MHHLALRVVAAIFLSLAIALPAAAEEVIHSFVSDVELLIDGSVDVTETIRVTAEGRQIRRGIFRDIPTVLENDDGSLLRSNLDVIAVTKDGEPEPWFTEGIDNGTRIYIGDSDVFLSTGQYTYTIHYTMTRMARMFEDHDELFWNATGNFWVFPIETAVARITLPEGAVISDLVAATGRQGDDLTDKEPVTITRTGDNTATIRTTQEMDRYEGLTVAAAFQKGVLTEPGVAQRGVYFLSDHRGTIIPIIAVFIVLLYNFFAWDAVGRDPEKGTIIPLFHPPEGFSPALVHYVHRMGWQKSGWTAFTAALISLAVKGLLTITDLGKKKTKLEITEKEPEQDLPPGEALVFAYLKSKGDLTINKKTGPGLNTKRGEFIKKLEGENREAYFRNNVWYVVLGIIISVICLFGMVLTGVLPPIWLFIGLFGGIFIGIFVGILSGSGSGKWFGRAIVLVWLTILVINMGGAFFRILIDFQFSTAAIAAISIVIINVAFAVLMRAPTVQGRKLMDKIEGFKMYLETAEKERLNLKDEPELTPARFEAILPFAIALGVEKPWSEHFEAELARHATDGTATYSPYWYHGGNFSSGNFGTSMASMASGVSASMVAAQPAKSSSSGFSGGGGGFSGGGGGGGGGGGW